MTGPRKHLLGAALGLAAAVICAPARGDDKSECLGAASQGQTFRDDHKLLEAQASFRVCARQQCPAVVQTDCTNWLDTLDRSIPTVVFSAKDENGADIFDVRVLADGQPVTSKLDGVAVPMNPGAHTFRFERADGTSLEAHGLVLEGQKALAVAASFARPGSGGSTASPGTPASTSGAQPRPGGPWKTLGWVAGATGVAGLGLGTAFGLVAISKKNSASCGADQICTSYGAVSDAKSAATVANVGFVAGGALLATGALLLIFGGSSETTTGSVHVAPTVAASGAGLVVGGGF